MLKHLQPEIKRVPGGKHILLFQLHSQQKNKRIFIFTIIPSIIIKSTNLHILSSFHFYSHCRILTNSDLLEKGLKAYIFEHKFKDYTALYHQLL